MADKDKFQTNNTNLQTLLTYINSLPDVISNSNFIPTNSGDTNRYKLKLKDNNIDLEKLLIVLDSFGDDKTVELIIQDFEFITNDDGTYTLTDWKGTYQGVESTKCIIPNKKQIIL